MLLVILTIVLVIIIKKIYPKATITPVPLVGIHQRNGIGVIICYICITY